MKIVFDQGTPVPLRRYLHPHVVDTASELGWSTLENGNLLAAIVREKYDVLITTDQNLKHQQNISKLPFGIIVLRSTSWPKIRQKIDEIHMALDNVIDKGLIEVAI